MLSIQSPSYGGIQYSIQSNMMVMIVMKLSPQVQTEIPGYKKTMPFSTKIMTLDLNIIAQVNQAVARLILTTLVIDSNNKLLLYNRSLEILRRSKTLLSKMQAELSML